MSDPFILAAAPRCEEGRFNLPIQPFLTPSVANTMKQLLKDTTKYGVEKIGVQIRASVGHFFFSIK